MTPQALKRRRRLDALAQLKLISAAEKRLAAEIRAELSKTIAAAAAAFPAWESVMEAHRSRLQVILTRHIASIGKGAAIRARGAFKSAHLLQKVELKADTSDELAARILKFAKKRAATKVVDISKTTERRIRRAIASGLAADAHPSEIARDIVATVDDMSLARARTIARTESHTAAMTGQQLSMEETGEELGLEMAKTWVATSDDRTRETHSAADGQTVGMREWFTVGEAELYFPGDPDGAPEEVINCRCAVTYEPA